MGSSLTPSSHRDVADTVNLRLTVNQEPLALWVRIPPALLVFLRYFSYLCPMFDIHLHINTLNTETIMATLQELQQQVTELQASVDAEQAQIQALLDGQTTTIAALTAQIAELQALVDAAPTPEQLQTVVDSLQTIKADIEATVV